MKGITEESLKELIRTDDYANDYIDPDEALALCKELDTLTVSKLRPMCENPEVPVDRMSAHVLLYTVGMSTPRISRFDLYNGFDTDAKKYGIGWLYLPIYKPEDDHREKINLGGRNGEI